MKNNKLGVFIRLFVLLFAIIGVSGYFAFRDFQNLEFLAAYFYKQNAKSSIYDYMDATAKLKMLHAKSSMKYYKDNYSELVDFLEVGDMDSIKKVFNEKENFDYYKEFLKDAPELSDIKDKVIKERNSIINEDTKYSFYREFIKNTSAYALYCASTDNTEEFIDVIDKMSGVTVAFAWGYTGKPLMIESMIGLAMKSYIQDTIGIVFQSEINNYKNMIDKVSINMSESDKKRIAEILKNLEKAMPTSKDAMLGEKNANEKFMEFASERVPFGLFIIDIIFNPFTSTEKVISNYYNECIATIENSEDYEKVRIKYTNKWNPLVKMLVVHLSKANEQVQKSKEQNVKLIKSIKEQ